MAQVFSKAKRLSVIKSELVGLGYCSPGGSIAHEYSYTAGPNGIKTVELVAFADEHHQDISTACITLQTIDGDERVDANSSLVYTGAPIVIHAYPRCVTIQALRTEASLVKERGPNIKYGQLGAFFGDHESELSPRSMLVAKRGRRQLSFVDVDPEIEGFAQNATKSVLVERFREAISTVSEKIRTDQPKTVGKVAIWLLGASILADRVGEDQGNFEGAQAGELWPLLKFVSLRYSEYFDGIWKSIERVGRDNALSLYKVLTTGITFTNFTNDILGYFYENALVNESLRDRLGIYYTPRYLAERMLGRLPVEELPPEERTVVDGTCGSGSLLLASSERLRDLPANDPPTVVEQPSIFGLDTDPFACDVARLSLLLYNLPTGNDWKIAEGDVLSFNPDPDLNCQPGILVGNPPFHEARKDQEKTQLAAQILLQYLDWLDPGGLMAVLLPLTFLQNASGRAARERLLSDCDVLELWELPAGTIPRSSAEICVVIGRKRGSRRAEEPSSVSLCRVEDWSRTSSSTELLSRQSRPDFSYVVRQKDWMGRSAQRMTSSPLDDMWEALSQKFEPLSPTFADFHNGMQPGKEARSTHFSQSDQGAAWRRVLYSNAGGQVLQPFNIAWGRQDKRYIRYPSDDFHRPRRSEIFDATPKVVLNASRNQGSPWRLYSAIDRSALVVTENFHCVIPRAASAPMLAAVLNSSLANAWYSSWNVQRDINLSQIRKLPFPRYGEKHEGRIRRIINNLSKLAGHEKSSAEKRRRLFGELDTAIYDLYRLGEDERYRLERYLSSSRRPGFGEYKRAQEGVKLSQPEKVETWEILGRVEGLDWNARKIGIWLPGAREVEYINIPGNMPGWALTPGITFRAQVLSKEFAGASTLQDSWLSFRPVDYSYLSDEDLLEALFSQGSG